MTLLPAGIYVRSSTILHLHLHLLIAPLTALTNDSLQSLMHPSVHDRVFKIRRDDPTPLPSPSYDDISSLGKFSQFRSFLLDSFSPSPSNCCTPASDTIADRGSPSLTRILKGFGPSSSSWLKHKPSEPENRADRAAQLKADHYLSVPLGNHYLRKLLFPDVSRSSA